MRRASRSAGWTLLALTALARVARAAPEEPWTVDRLLAAIDKETAAHATSAALHRDFEELAGRRSLPVDDETFRTYLRVKSVFEATREAGWWRIGWNVTNREPQSDAIWAAWRKVGPAIPRVTAVAECDESAALAAVLLRRTKVRSVGLFWPTSNHTVAVWKASTREGREARIVLPTSQVFLDPMDGFDTRAFDPARQRTIYDYTRADVRGEDSLPAPLARFFATQAGRYAGASDATQRALRVMRSRFMNGEAASRLEVERRAMAARLRETSAWPEDRAAVEAFAEEIAVR
jgi:Arc/MetJ-type ribon-helix-helix transcriptional regulator